MSLTHKTTTMTTMTTTTMTMILMLPEELIMLVKKKVDDHFSLSQLKISCLYFNKIITRESLNVSLTREIIHDKISNYKDRYFCINPNCYEDTEEIYEDNYHRDNNRYVHNHQFALNKSQITINKKDYQICTPYCSECFIRHVLIGDRTNVRRDFVEGRVIIDY